LNQPGVQPEINHQPGINLGTSKLF